MISFWFYFNFSYSYVRVEEYINQEFNGSDVKIEVIKGQTVFEDMYPCLAAVNRCASVVPRHDGRVIWLTYEPEGRKPFINKTMKISLNHGVVILKNSLHCYCTYTIFFWWPQCNLEIFFVKSQNGHTEKLFAGPVEKTVMLVGKGITYDTGGADIKAGGIMAGMYTLK